MSVFAGRHLRRAEQRPAGRPAVARRGLGGRPRQAQRRHANAPQARPRLGLSSRGAHAQPPSEQPATSPGTDTRLCE